MIKKLNIGFNDNRPVTKKDFNEVKLKINELIDVVNKASFKPVGEQTIEVWFNTNEERIIEGLRINPVPGEIYNLLKDEEPNLFIGLQDKDKKYIERRCNLLIEKHGLEKKIINHGKLLSECRNPDKFKI